MDFGPMNEQTRDLSEKAAALAIQYGMKLAGVLALTFAAWIAAAFIRKTVRQALRKAKFDETLTRFISNAARWVILVVAGVSILSVFGVQATSFAALIGAAGLAVGLAFQGTLANFAAGVMLLIFRPFKVMDVVQVGGVRGTVDEIDLFTTVIDTIDHRRVYVPNSAVFGSTIENLSYFKTRRMDLIFSCDTFVDAAAFRQEMEARLKAFPLIADRPAPALILKEMTFKSTDWEVQIWCESGNAVNVRHDALRAARESLDIVRKSTKYPKGVELGD